MIVKMMFSCRRCLLWPAAAAATASQTQSVLGPEAGIGQSQSKAVAQQDQGTESIGMHVDRTRMSRAMTRQAASC